MIEIDGSQKSGSGTIVRDAIPFSILLGEGVHLKNIRAKRDKPGLRPQHLKAIEAAAQISQGTLEGASVDSTEVRFNPGGGIRGGTFNWNIGTAGSATMLALSVIPLALFADAPSNYRITGGLFQDFAPSVYHLKYVLLPIIRNMGAQIDLRIIQSGYVPQGEGQIEVKVIPLRKKLKAFTLNRQGNVISIKGIALSSLLKERKVSERMAEECMNELKTEGYDSHIDIIYDTKEKPTYDRASIQAGAALAVWAGTDTGCLLGADMAGKLRRGAEFIGRQTAKNLLEDLMTGATVDRFLADQIIPYAALAEGYSSYLFPRMTDHIESRLWLIEEMLGAEVEVKSNLVNIKGAGYLVETKS
ncbi:MAG TPA: RNA 3'-terminal phosphate cyclase [Thermodesulfobacteriota bacterium]|nr:RNA 3'-terminal phosphate cyclase [Thermodesulfobacteriota bacterium]